MIIAAHRALPEDIRSAPATVEELAAFESNFGPIPPSYRWYLEHCGGGVAGSEWLDDIHRLAQSHRKFQNECGEGGWTLRDVFIIGWDGGGNPFAISTKTGEVVVEDHDFGGIHVLAPSFQIFSRGRCASRRPDVRLRERCGVGSGDFACPRLVRIELAKTGGETVVTGRQPARRDVAEVDLVAKRHHVSSAGGVNDGVNDGVSFRSVGRGA